MRDYASQALRDYQAMRDKATDPATREYCEQEIGRLQRSIIPAEMRNAKAPNTQSGYRGVVCRVKRGTYEARVITWSHGRKCVIYAGEYTTTEQAARAYDWTSWQLYHDRARLNFPHETPAGKPPARKMRLPPTDGVTDYRGVWYSRDKYRATLYYRSRRINAGTFDDPKQAALAYDRLSWKLYRDPRRLNFPALIYKHEGTN